MRLPLPALSERATGFACVLFSICVWSGWVIASSYSVRGTLSTYDIAAIRFGTAGLILLPVLIRKGLRIGPYGRFGSVWLALLMGAPYNIIAVFGMKFAPASHAAGIINTTMLTVATLGGIFLLREKTTKLRLCGLALSIAGIGCILYAGDLRAGGDVLIGHLLFILGGTIWAFYALSMRAWRVDPLHATSAVCVISLLIYLPIYLLFIPSHISMHNLDEVAFQAIYQGIVNSIFALLLFNRAVAILGATTSCAFLPLVPVLATLLAVSVLGEVPNWLEGSGILLAGIGVLLSTGIIARHHSRGIIPLDGASAGN